MGGLKKIVEEFLKVKSEKRVYLIIVIIVIFVSIFILVWLDNKKQNETTLNKSTVLQVFDDNVGGYRQVYTINGSVKSYITNDQANNTNAVTDGKRVAWTKEVNGANQVFLHDLKDRTTLQMTFYGSSSDVVISEDIVAWVTSLNNRDQVYFFDGIQVVKASDSIEAKQPVIDKSKLAFIQTDGKDWRIVLLDTINQSKSIISVGEYKTVAYPRFVNGVIVSGITQN